MGRCVNFRFGSTEIVVNVADQASLLQAAAARLAGGQGFALATLNLDHLVKLRACAQFRDAYAAQDLIVADGNPIVWLSHLAGRPVSLVPGSDLVEPLARLAARAGAKVALVGSTQTALAAAAIQLTRAIPDLNIVLRHAPAMGFDPTGPLADQVLADLARLDVGLFFVALEAPKQEMFAARGRRRASKVGFASVGAGLDFLAGSQHRAPVWVRRMAMEWAWRAVSSPNRLIPRYAACAAILPAQITAALRLRSE